MEMYICLTKKKKEDIPPFYDIENNQILLDEVVNVLDGLAIDCDTSLSKDKVSEILNNLRQRRNQLLTSKDGNSEEEFIEIEEAFSIILEIYNTFDFDNYTLYLYYGFYEY